MLSEAANGLVRVFLAPTCVGCDGLLERPLRGPVCDGCWRAVESVSRPWCARCGDELPLGERSALCARCGASPPSFTIARSAGRYDGPLKNIIHAFKYEHRRPLARPLAALMLDVGPAVLDGAAAVVPVPLHPLRALRRGFNQADDLAVHLGLPVWRALRRSRHGPPQAALPAERRHPNVRNAFANAPTFRLWKAWRSRSLHRRTVVLVDDVMTTGATLDACSIVLLDAGVSEVRALTVARAVAARRDSRPGPPHRAIAPRR